MSGRRAGKSGRAAAKPAKSGADAPEVTRGPLSRLFRLFVLLVVWAVFAGLVWALWVARDLPDVSRPPPLPEAERVTVLAIDGSVLATYGPAPGRDLSPDELPKVLADAVVATEDRRFFSHHGIDPRGIARAMVTNLRHGRLVQGGSTITQQLAKNLFLRPDRSLRRKLQELLLALYLEQTLSKREILALYLNRVYFGAGAYGVDAAARSFFGHGADRLSLREAALLAGLLKAPSRLQPLANLDGAWARARSVVLPAMVATGRLDAARMQAAVAAGPPRLARRFDDQVRYATDRAVAKATALVGGRLGSARILTTLDPHLQRAATQAVRRVMKDEGPRRGAGEAALVALTPDGAVEALVGGVDYATSQYDRAVAARRQPGSAMKPFVYAAALAAGHRITDRVLDAPVEIDGWRPRNFDGRYHGEVTLYEAFVRSYNSVAARLLGEVGPARVVAFAHRFGLAARLQPVPSLALGTEEVTLIDLTRAYAPFMNGGVRVEPWLILEVARENGPVLYRYAPPAPPDAPVVGRGVLKSMQRLLVGVVNEGTARNARLAGRIAGGKTGTTQDFRDAVFIGFTADHLAGVWVGNDDNRPMKGVTGGSLPARIWKAFMMEAHRGLPARPLPEPIDRQR
ncbi:MAG: PBP1A family penicillin-binding protein [Alphaproteobacteria bacterium]|nr:MAG: PBP1A family penicillin-binding protein [Alphaproteobacteria bacterium]